MQRYNLFAWTTAVVAVLILAGTANSQYWFQSGARGSNGAAFNNGAGVTIQTIYQNATDGSLGFWVGESLSNGAFIQAGYEITNATGYYSASCGNYTKSVFLQAGVPTWFWEYFTAEGSNSSFCGRIGPNGSAGVNGSYNSYSFRSSGSLWSAYFNSQLIGTVNLGTGNSGPNPPSAFAEYAETSSNKWPMNAVKFMNLLFYIGNLSMLVPEGYSSISYGKGSLTGLQNPYGVQEIGNFTNYFEVGSNLPVQKAATLWHIGYSLAVYSDYGNVTGSGNYIAYSLIPLSVPRTVNISAGVREAFTGWVGSGADSYTGNNTNPYITIYNNITERATWRRQYYLDASTKYGRVFGAGWYYANSSVAAYISSNTITVGTGSREVFNGWSNGDTSNKTIVHLSGPKSVGALWEQQYYLNATTPYGKAAGSGWYNSGSRANISLDTPTVSINQSSRLAFSGWSNGDTSISTNVIVNSPIDIGAVFGRQYLVLLSPENSYGQDLSSVDYYNISSSTVASNSVFLFENKLYNIEYIYYKGVLVSTNYRFTVNAPTALRFRTPIYNIAIQTQSVFGTPINASVNITFKNKTNLKSYSGREGNLLFQNVPYGYVTGYANYFGIKESINLANGASSYLTFLTASLIAFIVGGILVVLVVARAVAYYEQRNRTKIPAR